MGKIWRIVICSLFLAVVFSGNGPVSKAAPNREHPFPVKEMQQKFREGELLVKFKEGVSENDKKKFHQRHGSKKIREFKRRQLQQVKIKKGVTVQEALEIYRVDPDVELVGPNYIYQSYKFPRNKLFDELWGLHNTGQTGGTPDADIDAPEAWDITTGDASTVVAIIDSGIDYNHINLVDNIWVNQGEIPGNGVDDDGNGYVDDIHGIDPFNQDSNPMDDLGHGTHVAGIIGAAEGTKLAVTGVNWHVQLLSCKFMDANGFGDTAAAIECLDYVKDLKENHNVNVAAINASWGDVYYDQFLYDGIQSVQDILFVAAAGNDFADNDVDPHYPAGFDLPNIIAVASTDYEDQLSFDSDYGRNTVHIGAPGDDILSTTPGNNLWYSSGTSMAASYVTGLAALLKSQDQSRNWLALKNLILAGGDTIPAMESTTISGKRINAYGSLDCFNKPLLRLIIPDEPVIGAPTAVSALSINCDAPVGPVSLTLSGGESVDLHDDGLAPDRLASDGIFTGTWVPTRENEVFILTSPELTKGFTIPPFTINIPGLPSYLSLGKTYSFSPEPTGGIPPYSWSISTGSLPPGLSLNGSTGEISGTPTSMGEFVFTVLGEDAYQNTAAQMIKLSVNSLYELWAVPYGDPNSYDQAEGIAVDNDGNVYVTGRIGNNSFVTVKYDPAGNEQWEALFNGGGSLGRSYGITLDGNGSLYVTGSYNGGYGHYDFLTVKYDAATGSEIWNRHYEYEGYDYAYDVTVDVFGNIFVTGTTAPESGYDGIDILTLKYDADGNAQIFARYDSGNSDYARSVITDASGNVYVIGEIRNGSVKYPSTGEILAVKFDPSGNVLWAETMGQPNIADLGMDTAIDSEGNLYIAGSTYSETQTTAQDYEIFKLDPDGNQLWSTTYDRFPGHADHANGIAVDNSGNVYVTGFSGGLTITLVLTSDGEITSVNGYDSGYYWDNGGNDIAVDDDGNVYVATMANYDWLTIKYLTHLSVATLSLPMGQIYIPYNQPLTAALGVSPYTWSVVSGSLPAGLALDSATGEIYGTPTSEEVSVFTVQVADASGATAEQSLSITIQEPKNLSVLINGSGLVTSAPAGITCPADCDEEYLPGNPITLTAFADPGWVFDGWSGGGCSGTDDCIVTITDDTVVTATFSELLADFTGTPTTGTAPLLVDFTDLSGPNPTSWAWDFGDSQTSTKQHPVYVYETPGTYPVSLTAGFAAGSASITKNGYITVSACPNLPVKVGGDYYPTLQEAYNNALDTEVIESQALTFTEDLLLDRNIAVTLAGGGNCEYTSNAASTTINGTLTIKDGSLTVEHVVIRAN